MSLFRLLKAVIRPPSGTLGRRQTVAVTRQYLSAPERLEQRTVLASSLDWFAAFGSLASDTATDAAGNVYVVGGFSGNNYNAPLDFDPGPGEYSIRANNGTDPAYGDAFLVKLNDKGEFQWVRTLTVPSGGVGIGHVDIATDGTLRVIGSAYNRHTWASSYLTAGQTIPIGPGRTVSFACSLSTDGTFLWATALPNTIQYLVRGAVDPLTNAMLVGNDSDSLYRVSDEGIVQTSPLPYSRLSDLGGSGGGVALERCEFDKEGNMFLVGRLRGGADFDPSGNVREFYSTFQWGPNPFNSYYQMRYWSDDVFIAKYSAAGTFEWVTVKGVSAAHETIEGFSLTPDGDAVVATRTAHYSTSRTIYSYASDGTERWSRVVDCDYLVGLAHDATGTIVLVTRNGLLDIHPDSDELLTWRHQIYEGNVSGASFDGHDRAVVWSVGPVGYGNRWPNTRMDSIGSFPIVSGTKNNGAASSFPGTYVAVLSIVNEAPTGLSLANTTTSLPENTPTGSRIKLANIVITDDALGTNSLLLSGTDADRCEIDGLALYLRAGAVLNYEAAEWYAITVSVLDSSVDGSTPVSTGFTLAITNVNEPPTNIAISSNTVAENQPSGTTVGAFSTTDADAGDTFTYTLVSGAGSTDNASFTIAGGQLRTAASFNYETKASYSIRVRSTDQGGLFVEKVFAVVVTDVNESPTGIALSNEIVAANKPAGAVVGLLSTADPDGSVRITIWPSPPIFTYFFVAGAGSTHNGLFRVVRDGYRDVDELVTAAPLAAGSYSIRLRSTDPGGLHVEKTFSITATNVNDSPTVAGNAFLPAVSEDAANPGGVSVLSLLGGSFRDADAGDVLRGVVLTANAASLSQGRWQWLNGTTWTTIGTTLSEAAGVFFAVATSLRFLPAANYSGTPGALTMRLVDSSATSLIHGRTVNVSVNGGTTPFSAANVTLGTSITAVNDAPLTTGSATLAATTEDAINPPGATVAKLFADRFSDAADAVAGGAAHTLAGVVLTANAATAAQGRWQWLDGATWKDVATSLSPAAGLHLAATTSIRFLPAAHYNGTPGSLTARLVDSSATGLTNGALVNASLSGGTTPYSAATVTLGTTVTAVKDAPLATGSATLAAILEDATNPPGATVAALFAGNFRDTADAVPGGSAANTFTGIVLTGNAATPSQGRWQWLNGTTWSNIATSYTDSAGVFFAAATMLRFLPVANYNGTPGPLTVRLVDSSATGLVNARSVNVSTNGGTTPFSAASVTLGTSVTAVNDAPLATGSATLPATTEDATNPPGATVATLFAGRFADAADTVPGGSAAHALAGVVLIAKAATLSQGRWQWLNGSTWTTIGTTVTDSAGVFFTAATSLRFLPAANFNGTPGSLTVRLVDSSAAGLVNGRSVNVAINGGTTPFSAAKVVLGTNVTAVNNAPLATGSATLAATTQDATNPPGATVASLFAGTFSDPADAVPGGSAAHTLAGVVLIANTATAAQGRWQWFDGATWTDIATSLSRAAGLYLAATTSIRFLPAATYTGTPGPLTVRIVDSTATGLVDGGPANVSTSGGVTPFSAASVVLGTSVTAVIDIQP
jgi:hypothetical protein